MAQHRASPFLPPYVGVRGGFQTDWIFIDLLYSELVIVSVSTVIVVIMFWRFTMGCAFRGRAASIWLLAEKFNHQLSVDYLVRKTGKLTDSESR